MSGTNQGHAFPAGAQLTAAALCWGLGTVLTKYSLEGIGASVLLPFQLACSVGLLGIVMVATDASPRRIGDRAKVAALGVLNPGIAYALGLVGLARIEASLSVIIWATEPVLIVVLALGVLSERLRLPSLVCLISAMTGVTLIVGAPSGGPSPVGVVLTFAAVFACALYSVLLQRMRLTDGTLPIVFVQQLSALAFAIVLLLVSGWDLRVAVDATVWEVVSDVCVAGGHDLDAHPSLRLVLQRASPGGDDGCRPGDRGRDRDRIDGRVASLARPRAP